MIPATVNFTMYKGAAFGPICLKALDQNQVAVDLTGWNPRALVREKPLKPVILDLKPTVTDGPNGQIIIPLIEDEDTEDFPRGCFVWDLLIENPAGQILGPFISGSFVIQPAISRV